MSIAPGPLDFALREVIELPQKCNLGSNGVEVISHTLIRLMGGGHRNHKHLSCDNDLKRVSQILEEVVSVLLIFCVLNKAADIFKLHILSNIYIF